MQSTRLFDIQWEKIPSPVDEVDIWRAPVELRTRKVAHLATLLSSDERERSRPSSRHAGYERYVTTKGLLRVILATYLDIHPSSVEFHYGPAGKPRLADKFDGTGFKFNLAHSGGVALVAVTKKKQIGIDIERMSLGRDLPALIEQSLTAREREKWLDAMPPCRRKIFYRFWVRKEAYLKATGSGLTFPINRVDVSCTSYRSDYTVTVPIVDGEPVPWSIYDLDLPRCAGTTLAAIALEGVPNNRDAEVQNFLLDHPSLGIDELAEAVTV
jgi:4'-phosphopantetheinyl transferase